MRSVLLLGMLLFCADVASVQTLTLKQAIENALNENVLMQSHRHDRQIMENNHRIVQNTFSPKLHFHSHLEKHAYRGEVPSIQNDLSFAITPSVIWKSKFGTQSSLVLQKLYGPAIKHSSSETLSMSIEQPLLKGFLLNQDRLALEGITAQEHQNRLDAQDIQRKLIEAVSLQYREIQATERKLQLQRNLYVKTKKKLSDIVVKVNMGRVAKSEIFDWEIYLNQITQSQYYLKSYLEQSKIRLWQLMGLHYQEQIMYEAFDSEASLQVLKPLEYYYGAIPSNSELERYRLRMANIQNTIKLAKNNRLPNLTIFGELSIGKLAKPYKINSLIESASGRYRSAVMARLSYDMPISDQRQRVLELKNAFIERDKLQLSHVNYERQLALTLYQIWHSCSAKKKQIEVSNLILGQVRKNVFDMEKKYEVGRVSFDELRQKQDQLLEVQQRIVDEKIAYQNMILKLDHIVGM